MARLRPKLTAHLLRDRRGPHLRVADVASVPGGICLLYETLAESERGDLAGRKQRTVLFSRHNRVVIMAKYEKIN